MKITGSILKSACVALSTLSIIAACSDAQGPFADDQVELTDDQVELTDDQIEEIGELTLALNSNTNCGTANPADKSYTSIISPSFTSPSTYSAGRNGCEKAYFVRVSSYRTGNTTKYNAFEYAGADPSTAAACRDTRLMVYAFERTANSAVFIDNGSVNGVPEFLLDNGTYVGCVLPSFAPDSVMTGNPAPFNLITGRTYQFAVSARTNNSGNPVMQPIRMTSRDRLSPPR